MWNPQAAAPLAAIQAALRDAAILGAVIRAEVIPGAGVIPEAAVIPGAATRAEAVREVIPQADNKAPDRTLKTTQKCSR
jgi:hypothetical protein